MKINKILSIIIILIIGIFTLSLGVRAQANSYEIKNLKLAESNNISLQRNLYNQANNNTSSTNLFMGHSIGFYVCIIVVIISVVYTGIRVKRNKFEDKYDK